ncbi:putative mitochondrial protein [Andalucia godoyi]|uniref:Putative mitochondrial protein n=1 Tax=Andalucia godoyi TaxID=505711 RepID=A0A8K0AIK4_ANDGO|nr:putative mitochondrial protein [Andalucia godoyi]|eukprot:ANDGO_08532.mRNA.1 putative mitochondrial protein
MPPIFWTPLTNAVFRRRSNLRRRQSAPIAYYSLRNQKQNNHSIRMLRVDRQPLALLPLARQAVYSSHSSLVYTISEHFLQVYRVDEAETLSCGIIALSDLCTLTNRELDYTLHRTSDFVGISNATSPNHVLLSTTSGGIMFVSCECFENEAFFECLEFADLTGYMAENDRVLAAHAHPSIPFAGVVLFESGAASAFVFQDEFLIIPCILPSSDDAASSARFINDSVCAIGSTTGSVHLFDMSLVTLCDSEVLEAQDSVTPCGSAVSDVLQVDCGASTLLFVGHYDGSISVLDAGVGKILCRYPSRPGLQLLVKFPGVFENSCLSCIHTASSSSRSRPRITKIEKQELVCGQLAVTPRDDKWLFFSYADGSAYVLGLQSDSVVDVKSALPDVRKFMNSVEVTAPSETASLDGTVSVFSLSDFRIEPDQRYLTKTVICFDVFYGFQKCAMKLPLRRRAHNSEGAKCTPTKVDMSLDLSELPSYAPQEALFSERDWMDSTATTLFEETSTATNSGTLSISQKFENLHVRSNNPVFESSLVQHSEVLMDSRDRRIAELEQDLEDNRQNVKRAMDMLAEFMDEARQKLNSQRKMLAAALKLDSPEKYAAVFRMMDEMTGEQSC